MKPKFKVGENLYTLHRDFKDMERLFKVGGPYKVQEVLTDCASPRYKFKELSNSYFESVLFKKKDVIAQTIKWLNQRKVH